MRAGYTNHGASGHKTSRRACGSSPCFGVAYRPTHTRGWAQHIADCWRNAVSNRPAAPAGIELTADEFLSDNPHRGDHGMHVRGA
jgi:hypothetical protein